MLSLADTLTEKARHLRRFIILDCCFAAAAFSAFQTGPAQVAIEKVVDAFEVRQRKVGFPAKGTALLCSSSQKSPSLLLPDGSSTMFTKALLDALSEGLPSQRERLTLREMKDIAADLLSETRNAPRPVVLSPDQSEGDVADIPFFPNPRAEEERTRKIEEEKRRLEKEAVRIRRMEEERQQRIEEERARQVEKERARKESEEQAPRAREERQRQAFETTSQLPHPIKAMPGIPPAQPQTELGTPPSGQPSTKAVSQVDRPVHMIQQRRLPTRRTMLVSGLTLAIVLILAVSLVGLYEKKTPMSPPTPTPQTHVLNPTTVSRLMRKWSFQTGTEGVGPGGSAGEGPCCTVDSSPTVVNGVVYVGLSHVNSLNRLDENNLYAINATSGHEKWAYQTRGQGIVDFSSPTVVNGVVYVSSSDGNLYAIDATSGQKKWVYQTELHPPWALSSPTVVNSVVYVGSQDQHVYAFALLETSS